MHVLGKEEPVRVLHAALEGKECILLEYFSIEIDMYSKLVSWVFNMRSDFCKSSVPAFFLLLNGVANDLNYELWSHVWLPFFSSLVFFICEAYQYYCFQLVYMLVAEMIFCKTVSNIRSTGRLRNMYSEIQQYSCVKKSLSKSYYGLH